MGRHRRRALLGFAAALALGLAALLYAGLTRESHLVQTLGVAAVYPVAPIKQGQQACQNDIGLGAPLERVQFNVGTFGKPGPPLDVTVRTRSGARLGRIGRVAGGWRDDGSAQEVSVGRVSQDQIVSVCIRNRGRVRAYVYGDTFSGSIRDAVVGVRPTVTPSYATVEGFRVKDDLSMNFVSSEARSLLARVPDMFQRASRFRPRFVGAWTYWILLIGGLLLAPLLLWRAFASGWTPGDRHPVETCDVDDDASTRRTGSPMAQEQCGSGRANAPESTSNTTRSSAPPS